MDLNFYKMTDEDLLVLKSMVDAEIEKRGINSDMDLEDEQYLIEHGRRSDDNWVNFR